MNNEKHFIEIDAKYIEENNKASSFGKRILYFEEVDSTNSIAKRIGKEKEAHGLLIIAGRQLAGRGRLGRSWCSPKNSGIWMSLVLKPNIQAKHASKLTLIAALAVNKAINRMTDLKSKIKWPNDIVINGKKVCGILTEMNTSGIYPDCVIIGIGINVNIDYFPEEISSTATSLQLETDVNINKNELVIEIMHDLEMYYHVFIKTESLKEIIEEYNEALVNRNRQVRIIDPMDEYMGVALGIDDSGALLVETDTINNGVSEKIIKTVVSGEVSVRGVYGYI